MTTQQQYTARSFWTMAVLTLLLSGFMAFINLDEYVKIGVLNQTTNYPFGGEGPTPWYYNTADLYAKVNLAFGLAFLTTFIAAIWTILKRRNKGLLITLLSTIAIIVIMYVNGMAN